MNGDGIDGAWKGDDSSRPMTDGLKLSPVSTMRHMLLILVSNFHTLAISPSTICSLLDCVLTKAVVSFPVSRLLSE